MQYTHRQACRHESETIKSTEAAETAGGGLWPHCTTGCRIIELDLSDRSVSGTKCTDEFLAALTMALIYRLFWSPLLCFTAQLNGKGERQRWRVAFCFTCSRGQQSD